MNKEIATKVFESLASGIRLDVWRLLVKAGLEGQVAGQLASELDIAPNTLSFHLKAMLHDPRHDVLFVGYQAQGTPGHAIQTYGPKGGYVLLDEVRYNMGAKISTIGGYSAHADQQGLVDFVTQMVEWPSKIRIVHGDNAAKSALAVRYQALYRQANQTVEITIPGVVGL